MVAQIVTLLGGSVELLDGSALAHQGEAEHLLGGLAYLDVAQPLHVGVPVEEQNPVDDVVCVLHLIDREVVEDLPETRKAPVVEHPGVQEVGIGDSEFEGERVIEHFDNSRANRLQLRPP